MTLCPRRLCFLCCLAQAAAISLALGQARTHGPVVGGVTTSTANVFVRTDQETSVALEYGTDPNLTDYTLSAGLQTKAAIDFTAMIPLAALQPETTYYLNVVVNGVPDRAGPPYPYFKTFASSAVSMEFKFVVLTDFTTIGTLDKPSPAFASAAAELPAFVFIGGDFDHRNPRTLQDKRTMFKELYDPATPFMSDFVPLILERGAIIHQWDDHDAGANNLDRTYRAWNLSQQVFQEYVPSYTLPSVTPGIWQKFTYAQAECFVLDCRSQRDPETDQDDDSKSMLDGNNVGAGGELEWLKDGLLASTARWKIIFTSVIVNPTTKQQDAWGAYQTEWNALKAFINGNNIQGVVFISGDLHLGAIDSGIASGFPEMCVAAANSQKDRVSCATAPDGVWSEGYFDDPCPGYGLVTVLTNPDRLVLQAVDESGATRVAYTVASATPAPTPTPAPPVITMQPARRTVRVGGTTKFRVLATGDEPLSYQWQKNEANITGANAASYTIPPAKESYNGELFDVIVSNLAGSVTSAEAKLTVKPAGP